MTARTRIVGWMLLLVGVALGSAVFVTYTVLIARVDDRVSAELTQEARKLRAYAATAVDPRTGRPFTDVRELLDRYLQRNLPDRYETFFTIIDGRATARSAPNPPLRLDTDRALVREAATARVPAYDTTVTGVGEVRYAVLPVRVTTDRRPAVLVAAEFRDLMKAREVDGAMGVLAVVGGTTLVVAGAASWLIAGRVLGPVRLVRRTAEEISESDLSRRIEVPTGGRHDDVAALARTFNAMLDRIELAFTTQREFLDDVGHELRTPITVVRGHVELMGDDPAERAETVSLVTDELDRMARIVDDLTVLAKSDRPDFLTWREVDLADLTVEVLAKARVLASRDWTLDGVARVRLHADPQRLTQALLQLVSNAVRYTSEGDVIAIGSSVTGAGVRLWVRDGGSGVAPTVADRVFERFVRSGPRAGAGLGLAIVRAIAEAHGGQAALRSRPGLGTTVTLELP